MGEFLITGLGVLGFFFAVTTLICWINTLTPAFEKGLVLGATCIVLPPIAFLWGWAKAGETGLKTNMLLWTVSLIPAIIFSVFVPQIADYVANLVA